MTGRAPRAYDFRMIPIDLIDPPAVAMRETMDDEKLAELAADIRANGLRQPIGVRPVSGRFRVSYGHRRRIACEIADELVVPCFVLADDDDEEENAKLGENWFREETNAAEEATYFAHQLEHRFHDDIELMCRRLRVSESRVNGRLELLRGNPDVLEALKRKQITLAVARELNRIRDAGWCRHYLADAVEQGANATTVRTWRMNFERFQKQQELAASGAGADVAPSNEVPLGSADICLICRSADDVHEMEHVRVHKSCLKVHERNARTAMAAGE